MWGVELTIDCVCVCVVFHTCDCVCCFPYVCFWVMIVNMTVIVSWSSFTTDRPEYVGYQYSHEKTSRPETKCMYRMDGNTLGHGETRQNRQLHPKYTIWNTTQTTKTRTRDPSWTVVQHTRSHHTSINSSTKTMETSDSSEGLLELQPSINRAL